MCPWAKQEEAVSLLHTAQQAMPEAGDEHLANEIAATIERVMA